MRKTKLVVAIGVLATLSITAILMSPILSSSHVPDRAVPANPLGIIGDVSWTNMSPSSSPGPRYIGAFVYDPPTDTYVLFGGYDQDLNMYNDTWSYDLGSNAWQNLSPANHPAFVLGPAYAYDPVDEIMLLFPCYESYATMNETWSYDASANEWNNLQPTNTPTFRSFSSAAYDSQSDKFVVFGGAEDIFGSATCLNDTWSYDFTSNSWTELSPVYSPFPRYGASMVYDSESDRVIMFGGYYIDSTGTYDFFFSETWSYDFDSNTWTNMTPLVSPSERGGASAVYDPISDLTLIFGGGGDTAVFDDMWAYDYDTNSWSEINELTKPPARFFGLMAIDPSTGTSALYGGWSESAVLGDTWSFQLGGEIPEFQEVALPVVGVIVTISALSGLNMRTRHQRRD